jgi:hypothetical protein
MERFLLLWDDLDDLSAACRHVTFSAIDEVGQISGAVGGAIAAFALWVLRLPT